MSVPMFNRAFPHEKPQVEHSEALTFTCKRVYNGVFHLYGRIVGVGGGESHPLKPERLKRTYELLTAYRAFDAPNSRLVAPVPASQEELPLFHTAEYLDAVAGLGNGLSPQPLEPRTRGLSKGDVLYMLHPIVTSAR
jgi:hypothetical protein